MLEEPFTPQADDLAAGVETSGDLVVGQALGGKENHLGADHFEIRQRILGGAAVEFTLFSPGQLDFVWAGTGHRGLLASHDAIRGQIFQLKIR